MTEGMRGRKETEGERRTRRREGGRESGGGGSGKRVREGESVKHGADIAGGKRKGTDKECAHDDE